MVVMTTVAYIVDYNL